MLSMAFNTTRSIIIERGAATRLATQVHNLGASSVLLDDVRAIYREVL
ncbi:hypothetical protein [Pseudomonas akapageensis]|nr:hypothetical protein [Pseudomonas akapageensis]